MAKIQQSNMFENTVNAISEQEMESIGSSNIQLDSAKYKSNLIGNVGYLNELFDKTKKLGLLSDRGVTFNNDSVSLNNPFVPIVQVTDLPSKFLPYKNLVPNPQIYYKPYLYGELKKLNQSKLSNKQLFEEVLKGIDCNFDKRKLTYPDFLVIGMNRRLSTLNTLNFYAMFTCPVCGSQNKHKFDHESIEFKDLDVPELPAIVNINNMELEFTPLTIEDYFFLFDIGMADDQIAYLSVMCRTDVPLTYPEKDSYGNKYGLDYRRFMSVYQIIQNINNSEDSDVLELLDDVFDHKLLPVIAKCTAKFEVDNEGEKETKTCDTPVNVNFDGGNVILMPFRESRKLIESRVQFGKRRVD